MDYPNMITPAEGEYYLNRNGSAYRCLQQVGPHDAVLERIFDRWTLTAHGMRQYDDGIIVWDWSSGGHWPQEGAT